MPPAAARPPGRDPSRPPAGRPAASSALGRGPGHGSGAAGRRRGWSRFGPCLRPGPLAPLRGWRQRECSVAAAAPAVLEERWGRGREREREEAGKGRGLQRRGYLSGWKCLERSQRPCAASSPHGAAPACLPACSYPCPGGSPRLGPLPAAGKGRASSLRPRERAAGERPSRSGQSTLPAGACRAGYSSIYVCVLGERARCRGTFPAQSVSENTNVFCFPSDSFRSWLSPVSQDLVWFACQRFYNMCTRLTLSI